MNCHSIYSVHRGADGAIAVQVTGRPLAQRQAPRNDPGAQCWICPHCHDDKHHVSGPEGCERQALAVNDRIQIGPLDV